MNKKDIEHQIYLLKIAKLIFKLSINLKSFVHSQKDICLNQNFIFYVFGKHSLKPKELIFKDKEQEKYASSAFEHSASFLMILQMDELLNKIIGKEVNKNPQSEIKEARLIIKFLRNAFAHNPYSPEWKIKNEKNYPKKILAIENIMTLDITNIT